MKHRKKLNVLDLFSGIGGFSLGLERADFKTVAFCEIDPFCRQVLKKHWPSVPIYEDISELNGYGIKADVICGGFPCQDISPARGKGAEGISGPKSGLWKQYARIIGEIRPRFIIVENSSALLTRGLGELLSDLAAVGYDAVWHCIPASAIGAPHQRDRIWIVAYSSDGQHTYDGWSEKFTQKMGTYIADANSDRFKKTHILREWELITRGFYWFKTAANVLGMGDGVPNWSHRIRALGNAVVPQIPELIGRAIMETTL